MDTLTSVLGYFPYQCGTCLRVFRARRRRAEAERAAEIARQAARISQLEAELAGREERPREREPRERAESLEQTAGPLVVALGAGGEIRTINRAAEEVTGYTRSELINRDWHEQMVPIEHYQEARAEFEWMLSGGPPRSFEHPILTKSGEKRHILWHSSGAQQPHQAAETIWYGIDITERRRVEDQLRHDALHDVLTGLPNRALLIDRLEHRMNLGKRRANSLFAVLFLDLDRFKPVNDGLGHAAGDRLLVEAARRMGRCLRAGDTLARWGGDEFVILADDLPQAAQAAVLAERIQLALGAPLELEREVVCPAASIGIVLSAPHYRQVEAILRDADAAMFRAKAMGGARWEFFQSNSSCAAAAG